MAGRRYSVTGSATAQNSATAPQLTMIGATAIRPLVYDCIVSSVATPADNSAKWQFQRCTTTGSAGSAIVPQALDPGDPAATLYSGLAAFSSNPTLTAAAFLNTFDVNQRATFRWVAAPGGEMIIPATASNGLALMNASVGGAAVAYDWQIFYTE